MYSVTLWVTNVKRCEFRNVARLSGEPVMKLSTPTTSQSRASRNSHRCDPMNPAAPVTRTRMCGPRGRSPLGRLDGLAADGVVLEAQAPHPFGLPEVAAVEEDGAAHRRAQPLQVEELELV